jgi:hypothetical protein
MEAIAWAKKYLIVVSIVVGLSLLIKMGINLIRLISRPTQATTQEEAEQARRVPVIKVVRKIKLGVLIKIKKGKGKLS